jgi:LmbE family N-acetylglucosaminyl deacetylase
MHLRPTRGGGRLAGVGRYTRPAMTHVFVSPHPDDVALSCGGLIGSLRELGQSVVIISLFSGDGGQDGLTPYQREALGFGSKALWPDTEAFNRANLRADYPIDESGAYAPPWAATSDRLEATQADADAAAKRFWQRSSWYRRASIHNEPLAGQLLADDTPTQGAVLTTELTDAESASDAMATRRLEDERYAYYAEAAVIFLDLPDAVFRGYQGDAELLGLPRDDDAAPVELLRREIARLEPQKVYFPLAIGNHVDHQLARQVGLELLREARAWVMPGPDWAGIVTFYEDFPYAWWGGFSRLEDLPDDALGGLPADVSIVPEFADVTEQIEWKISGVSIYASQLDRLFGGTTQMAGAVRAYDRRVAVLGGVSGFAERYWASTRL